MKVVFLTLGTRGDVQPYLALGKGLCRKGHSVVICTGLSFKDFIESNGVGFVAASADLMAILKTPEGQAIFNGGGNPLKTLSFVRNTIMPLYRQCMDDFLRASEGADMIIYHPKALGAVDIAEYLNIPCVCMSPVPIIYPIEEFPNLAIASDKSFGKMLNRLSYKVSLWGMSNFLGLVNSFRTERLNMPKRKLKENYLDVGGKPIPIIYPIDDLLFPEVTSWNGRVIRSGFFYLESETSDLPEHIQKFIDAGQPPVILSFSSMPLKNPSRFAELFSKAIKATGNRAIVLTGTSGLTFESDPSILCVDQLPHRLIFDKAMAIIHHGGVGTLSEALLSGKPEWIIPFNVDQPFWANRLYKMGLIPKPYREAELTEDILVDTLHLLSDGTYIDKAQRFSAQLKKQNGIQNAIAEIEKIVAGGVEHA